VYFQNKYESYMEKRNPVNFEEYLEEGRWNPITEVLIMGQGLDKIEFTPN